MNTINVLIVDDHTVVRKGIAGLLEQAEIKIIGEAKDGCQALEMVQELQPDVVLMDISMPGIIDGIEATREIKKQSPTSQVVILTMHENKKYLFEAIKAGAIGYVLKDCATEELVKIVIEAAKGMSFLKPDIAFDVLKEFSSLEKKQKEQLEFYSLLTNREKEILKCLAKGMRNKEIAKELYISDKTVRNHLKNIFEKLHINDRTAAAVMAVRQGLA